MHLASNSLAKLNHQRRRPSNVDAPVAVHVVNALSSYFGGDHSESASSCDGTVPGGACEPSVSGS